MQIVNVSSNPKVTVVVHVEEAPVVPVQYMNRNMIPHSVTLTYVNLPSSPWWRCDSAVVSGYRQLKSGAAGTETHHNRYYTHRNVDLGESGGVPEWLEEVAAQVRPSGALFTHLSS